MPVKLWTDEEAARLVQVTGTGLLFMVEGRMIGKGDKAHVPAAVAQMLVARGRAVYAGGAQ
jgi:hypothetical protein